MTARSAIAKIVAQEDLNFLLTNRLPRNAATRLMGRISRIEHPLVRSPSIAMWRFFADVDLSDSEPTRYRSLHHAFTRALRDGARPALSPADIVASPCDAIVGACGRIEDDILYQVKGFPYRLGELLGPSVAFDAFRNGSYATLRLTAGMYHRFHAPHDGEVEQVTYISGDTWNVNPITLRRIERLFCRNERAVIRMTLGVNGSPILLVPVAAILVAGIRLHFLDTERLLRDGGPRTVACHARLRKGEEMGWFEHGSTILVFAPPGVELCPEVVEGARVRAGSDLMRLGET